MNLRDVIIIVALSGVVAFLGVQVWNTFADDAAPDYEYLECAPIEAFGEGVTAVSGCAEIVEIGGEKFLKMTDVGTFTVYRGASAKTYDVGPAHVDLVLLTGQSNSYYCTSPQYWPDGDSYALEHDPGASPLVPGTAFYFGVPEYSGQFAGVATRANLAECGIVDMTAPDGSVRVAATYPVFMYDWIEMTGHRVVMVNSGIGGRSIASFMPGGDCYNWTMDVMEAALTALDPARFSVDPAGVLWSQGEADRDMPVADYEDYLVRLLNYLEDGEFGISFSNMYSTLPTHFGAPGDFNSAIAQMNVASYDDRFHVASTLPVELPLDGLQPYYRDQYHHYTQMVYDWMGEAFARSMAADQGHRTVPERVVYCPSATAGSVTVTAYGTSGAAYALDVSWTGTDATIMRTPSGTIADPRLTITAGSAPPEPDTYTVTFAVASDSTGYGTVSIASLPDVADGTSVTVGQTIVVGTAGQCVATPATDTEQYTYAFAGWTGADDSSTAAPATVTGNTTYYAHFTRTVQTYTVTFAVASDSTGYGTVSPATIADVPYGTAITSGQTIVVGTAGQCAATPATNTSQYTYAFDRWTGADDSSTAIPATVTGSITLYAHFTRTEAGPTQMDPSLFTYTVADGKATVTGWAGTPPADGYDLYLPDTDGQGHPLTGIYGSSNIDTSAFAGAKTLKSDTVTNVGQRAFRNASLLESVDLPAATSVGTSAFYRCTSLVSVSLPVATGIGQSTFSGCTSLASVSLPAVTSIDNYAFDNCTSIENVTFGPLTSLGSNAIRYWTFYQADGTTVLSKTAANLKNSTFQGTASALIKVAPGAKASDVEKRAAELAEENAAKLKALASVDGRLAELMDPSDVAMMTMEEIRALTAEDVEKMTAAIEEAREQEKMNTPPEDSGTIDK